MKLTKMKRFNSKSVLTLGLPGAGKTTFLTLLYHHLKMLNDDYRVELTQEESDTDYMYDLLEKLVYPPQSFPPPNPGPGGGFIPISIEIYPKNLRMGAPVQFKTFDSSGTDLVNIIDNFDLFLERVLEPKKTRSSTWFKNLVDFQKKMDGILFLIDPHPSMVQHLQNDDHLRKLFRLIYATITGPRISRGDLLEIPLAFVLTKYDKYKDTVPDPDQFIAESLPRSMEYVKASFRHVKVFTCSAVGGTVEKDGREVPVDPPKPEGVFEPVQWVTSF
ncbi:MAG: hypothetical protein ACTSU5_17610 [Promethearchaeota archaeon]